MTSYIVTLHRTEKIHIYVSGEGLSSKEARKLALEETETFDKLEGLIQASMPTDNGLRVVEVKSAVCDPWMVIACRKLSRGGED